MKNNRPLTIIEEETLVNDLLTKVYLLGTEKKYVTEGSNITVIIYRNDFYLFNKIIANFKTIKNRISNDFELTYNLSNSVKKVSEKDYIKLSWKRKNKEGE